MAGIIEELLDDGTIVVRMLIEPELSGRNEIVLRWTTLADGRFEEMRWDDTRPITSRRELLHANVEQLMGQLVLVHCLRRTDPRLITRLVVCGIVQHEIHLLPRMHLSESRK